MAFNNVKIKKYLGSFEVGASTIDSSETIVSEFINIKDNLNELFDTGQLIFNHIGRKEYKMFDRLAIEDDFFNWYIAGQETKLLDNENDLYQTTLTYVELTQKLKNYKVSNLDFKQFSTGGTTNLYETLFDVVERVRNVTPFELKKFVDATRVTFGTNNTNDDIWTQKGYTERLYNLLIEYDNVKEFKFIDRNLYEVYSEIFLEIGGVPKIIANDTSESVLDITLFSDMEIVEVTIDDYESYNTSKSINDYSTNAEVTTNNIINRDSPFVSGDVTGKMLQSKELIVDENIAIAKMETPIYVLQKAEVKKIEGALGWVDITKYHSSTEEFKLLQTSRGGTNDPSVQNSVRYQIGTDFVDGWGTNATAGGVVIWTNTVWANMFIDALVEYNDATDVLTDYKFRYTYLTLMKDNRFNVKAINFKDDNKFASLRVNSGERVNEYDKLVNLAQNKISRIGQRATTKKVKHFDYNDIYQLGALDLDTNLYIVSRDIKVIFTKDSNDTQDEFEVIYELASDLNILSEFVGVNSENRFTDIEIGGGVIRNETYEDWVLVTDEDISIEDTSSVNVKMLTEVSNMYKNEAKGLFSNYWLLNSQELNNPAIAPAIVSAGSRTLSWRIPLLSQTFVDNELTQPGNLVDVGANQKRLFERGVAYTQPNGLVDTLSLSYGQSVEEPTSKAGQQSLPNAELIITEGVNTRLFELGTTDVDVTTATEILTPNFNEIVNVDFSLLKRTEKKSVSKSYTIANKKIDNLRVDWRANATAQVNPDDISATITIDAIDSFGNNLLIDAITLPADIDGDIPEFASGAFATTVANFGSLEVTEITITLQMTSKYGGVTSGNMSFTTDEIEITTITATSNSNDGLFVDKNFNEVLTVEYMNHYSELKDYVVVGDGLTNKSALLPSVSAFTDIELWTSTNKYSKYDTKIVKGTKLLSPNLSTSIVGKRLSVILVSADFDLIPVSANSYAIVGIDSNGIKHLLHAVNRKTDGTFTNKVNLIWSHYHPNLVTKY